MAEEAQTALAELLAHMVDTLAAAAGVDPGDVVVGPVDFGPEEAG